MPSIIPTAYAAANMQQFTSNVLTPVIREIVNPIIWLMFGVATVVFIYGVLQMIIKGDDATAREAGQKSMLYGVIGMFIMVAAWGIVYLIGNTVKTF